jgi:hypothetical protein
LVIPEDEIVCALGNCQRRRLGDAKLVWDSCADRALSEKHYEFDSWKLIAGAGARLFVSEFFFSSHILPNWDLVRLRERNSAQPPSIRTFWEPKYADGNTLMRIDTFECVSWQEAREVVLSLLSSFQGPGMVQQRDPELGDIAFANVGFNSLLFATGNLVFFLRNAGKKDASLADVARTINNAILTPSAALSAYNSIKQFHFELGEARIGEPVRIVETHGDPLARRRFYQFFSEHGETSRTDMKLNYEPKSAGSNTVDILAVDAHGNVVKQVLTLDVRSTNNE